MLRPMSAPRTDPALQAALDACADDSALYLRSGLSLANHLPMVLHATSALGGGVDALARHRAHWAPRLAVQDAAERAEVAHFETLLAAHGPRHVLRVHLPALLECPQASAFHGPIRVSHAWQSGHSGELARALGSWRQGLFELGTRAEAVPDAARSPVLRDVLAAAGRTPELAVAAREGTTIIADMRVVAALPAYERWAEGDRAPADAALTVDALAEASLAVYLACRDFTALHLVTGLHAWRVLADVLAAPPAAPGIVAAAPPTSAARALWRAWLAAWLSIGAPAPDWAAVRTGTASEADWDDARPALLNSLDDHRVKLAFSARAEWRHRGWAGYARVLAPG